MNALTPVVGSTVVRSTVVPTARATSVMTRWITPNAEALSRRDAVARLYSDGLESLIGTAVRYVGNRDEAEDVVHEAMAILLESPRRKPTREAAWCIVRDLARDRRAQLAQTDEYTEGDPSEGSDKAQWLTRALSG